MKGKNHEKYFDHNRVDRLCRFNEFMGVGVVVMKLKVLSLFSGIGAFEKALKNVDVGVDLVNYCEIDKHASRAYSLIHEVSESMNLWDVTKIDTSELPNDIDLITYGFPCQDISLAGNLKGFEHNGERTRSGLFFEALRIIEDTKPKFAIAENVKNLTSKRFANEFKIVLDSLEQAGYTNYWKVLNAKDYGIPQNRERVFIISIRKDIDKGFEFPEPFQLELKLENLLEPAVDESFYVKPEESGVLHSISDDALNIINATKQGYIEGRPGDYVNLQFPGSNTRRGRVIKQCSGTLLTNDGNGVIVND